MKPIDTRSSPVFSSFIGYIHEPPIWRYLAGIFKGQPAHRVDHAIERLGDLPDLLDTELPNLRFAPIGQVELLDGGACEMSPAPLSEHGGVGLYVRSGSKLDNGSPSLPRPLSPERTPTTRPSSTTSWVADVSVRM